MLTPEQIQFLNIACPNRWKECNSIISVKGDVNMEHMYLTQIPVPFGQVTGDFKCSYNKLTTLYGCPSIVAGFFECDHNRLLTLEGGPKEVGCFYSCECNRLTNLIGSPDVCNGDFCCSTNQLTSLVCCPTLIKGYLYSQNNPNLKYIWGIGHIRNKAYYNVRNEINAWILECAQKSIIFPFGTFAENMNWIKNTNKYQLLLRAPEEIREHFFQYILHLVDCRIC